MLRLSATLGLASPSVARRSPATASAISGRGRGEIAGEVGIESRAPRGRGRIGAAVRCRARGRSPAPARAPVGAVELIERRIGPIDRARRARASAAPGRCRPRPPLLGRARQAGESRRYESPSRVCDSPSAANWRARTVRSSWRTAKVRRTSCVAALVEAERAVDLGQRHPEIGARRRLLGQPWSSIAAPRSTTSRAEMPAPRASDGSGHAEHRLDEVERSRSAVSVRCSATWRWWIAWLRWYHAASARGPEVSAKPASGGGGDDRQLALPALRLALAQLVVRAGRAGRRAA